MAPAGDWFVMLAGSGSEALLSWINGHFLLSLASSDLAQQKVTKSRNPARSSQLFWIDKVTLDFRAFDIVEYLNTYVVDIWFQCRSLLCRTMAWR